MQEQLRDQALGIRTAGLREWHRLEKHYHRYEATPYEALDQLFKRYRLKPDVQIVDFGAGRGRVSFYIHSRFNVPVRGIEVNETTLDEAYVNLDSYRYTFKKRWRDGHEKAPLRFEYGEAESTDVSENDNCFYFFNPFSLTIFKQVIKNIRRSKQSYPRAIDLVIYYPLPEIKQYLTRKTPFRIAKKIPAYDGHGKYGKFVIFRYLPEALEVPDVLHTKPDEKADPKANQKLAPKTARSA